MKKVILMVVFALLFMVINIGNCYASSSITYFYAEGIKIEEKDIEIISYEMKIDMLTSKVRVRAFLQNNSETDITTEIAIPIENKELDVTAHNVLFKLNDEVLENKKNQNGDYVLRTKFNSKSAKILYYEFITDNDLVNAKVIKCNFDNFKKKNIGKLKVEFKIDEKNIPLVEKIYPGHYKFKDNVISVEYYNYKPNVITREIIIQKETFNNLLYGRENEYEDFELRIVKDWYEGKTKFKIPDDEYPSGIPMYIIDYTEMKKGKSIGIYSMPPLIMDYLYENINNKKIKGYNEIATQLYGKTICIEFAETENNKKLYIEKYVHNEEKDEEEKKIVQCSERKILKTCLDDEATYGARVIFVDEGISGEKLNASTEEILQYVNSINSDMFIRIEIYDGVMKEKEFKAEKILDKYDGMIEYSEKKDYDEENDIAQYKYVRIGRGLVGYYDNKNYEVAKAFAKDPDGTELYSKNEYYNEDNKHYEEYSLYFKDYDDYKKNYMNEYVKECIKKFPNEVISSNSKVPTVIQFIGNRKEINGKYVVEFFEDEGFYNGGERGLITVPDVLKTSSAKNMISSNKNNNEKNKNEIENKINNLNIKKNERQIQDDLKKEEQEKNRVINLTNYKETNEDIVVYGLIGAAIVICVMILFLKTIRKNNKNKEDKNGNKE